MANNELGVPMPATVIGYETDDDSGYSSFEDLSVLTESIRSSVYDFKFENGRRYHAYKEGQYFMPNDEPEQERMHMQHHAGFLALDRRNYFSPIDSIPGGVRRILDLGTGTGIWAIEMGDAFPEAEVMGVDLSPIQPNWVPPNVRFDVDDLEDDWTYPESHFDFVFSKIMLAGSIGNIRRYLEQAFRHTSPGGYFEIQDVSTDIRSDHYQIPPDFATKRWCELMIQGITVMGRKLQIDFGEIASLMTEVGFVDVQLIPYKLPIGSWPADPTLKQAGAIQLVAMLQGIESLSLAIFTRCLGWKPEDVDTLLSQVKKDFMMRRACLYWPGGVIYGRKPEAAADPAQSSGDLAS